MAEVTTGHCPESRDAQSRQPLAEGQSPAASRQVRAVTQQKHQQPSGHGKTGRRHQRPLPGHAQGCSAHQVGQRRSQCQHAHQPGQGSPGILWRPGNDHFHAQGIDPGQTQPGGKAQEEIERRRTGSENKSTVNQSPQQARQRKDPTRAKAVGQAGHRNGQGACDKPGLHRQCQPPEITFGQAKLAGQRQPDTVDTEPERSAEKLGQNDHREGVTS